MFFNLACLFVFIRAVWQQDNVSKKRVASTYEQILTETHCTRREQDDPEGDEDRPRGAHEPISFSLEPLEASEYDSDRIWRHLSYVERRLKMKEIFTGKREGVQQCFIAILACVAYAVMISPGALLAVALHSKLSDTRDISPTRPIDKREIKRLGG